MTILGAVATDAGGLVWADSESLAFGETVSTNVSKIGIFPIFSIISVSAGAILLGRKGSELLHDCDGFDDAFERLPDHLRNARTGFEHQCNEFGVSENFCGIFIILGFSKRFKRNLIASFNSDNGFTRRLSRNIFLPATDFCDELDDDAVRMIAVNQLVSLRKIFPGASGGKLIVARFDEGKIQTYRMPQRIYEISAPSADDGARGGDVPASLPRAPLYDEVTKSCRQ